MCGHLIEKKKKFKEIIPTSLAPHCSRSLADEVEQMPAEHRRREGWGRKCAFCHILFFSHAAECRGSEARFNQRSVERSGSLRRDAEAPLAVQICLEKKKGGGGYKCSTCCFQSHTVCFSFRSYLIFPSCFPRVINHIRRDLCMQVCECVCHWEWVSGQMWAPRGKSSLLWGQSLFPLHALMFRVSLCVCENASAFRGWQTVPMSGVHHGCSSCGSSILSSR